MEEDVMERPIVIDERRQEVVQELMRNVYMWMTGGLALTGIIAWIVSNSPDILGIIFGSKAVFLWPSHRRISAGDRPQYVY